MAAPPSSQSLGIFFRQPVAVSELVEQLGGQLDAPAQARFVTRIAPPEHADHDALAPVLSHRSRADAQTCTAVMLVDASLAEAVPSGTRWIHPHARWVLASLLTSLDAQAVASLSSSAIIDPEAMIGAHVDVGAGAIVMSGAVIGDSSVIEPHAVIYARVRIGQRACIGAGAIIGRPGFGWAFGPDAHVLRMPQLGGVVIEDDVEVGPLCTIDAGTLGPTRIRAGCKLDAHVHVGHNVDIGAGTMVAAQVGFAGSARIGSAVLIGGQAGIADHVVIGDGARLAGKAGVIGNVAPGTSVAGYPAVERLKWLRSVAKLMRGRSA